MGIRRRIELILDKAAAKRVEKDTKSSLEKGTDPKKPEETEMMREMLFGEGPSAPDDEDARDSTTEVA